jgi:hypothetical protein
MALINHPYVSLLAIASAPLVLVSALRSVGVCGNVCSSSTPLFTCAAVLAFCLSAHRLASACLFGRATDSAQLGAPLKKFAPFLALRLVVVGLVLHPGLSGVASWLVWSALIVLVRTNSFDSDVISQCGPYNE